MLTDTIKEFAMVSHMLTTQKGKGKKNEKDGHILHNLWAYMRVLSGDITYDTYIVNMISKVRQIGLGTYSN